MVIFYFYFQEGVVLNAPTSQQTTETSVPQPMDLYQLGPVKGRITARAMVPEMAAQLRSTELAEHDKAKANT